MKAPKFVVLVAADEVFQEPSEHTLEMKRYEFDSFAAAWAFAHSRYFGKAFSAFINASRKQFDRPLIEGCIMLGSLVCASIEADAYACSGWSRSWEL